MVYLTIDRLQMNLQMLFGKVDYNSARDTAAVEEFNRAYRRCYSGPINATDVRDLSINVELVEICAKELKLGKAYGHDEIVADRT